MTKSLLKVAYFVAAALLYGVVVGALSREEWYGPDWQLGLLHGLLFLAGGWPFLSPAVGASVRRRYVNLVGAALLLLCVVVNAFYLAEILRYHFPPLPYHVTNPASVRVWVDNDPEPFATALEGTLGKLVWHLDRGPSAFCLEFASLPLLVLLREVLPSLRTLHSTVLAPLLAFAVAAVLLPTVVTPTFTNLWVDLPVRGAPVAWTQFGLCFATRTLVAALLLVPLAVSGVPEPAKHDFGGKSSTVDASPAGKGRGQNADDTVDCEGRPRGAKGES